MKGRLLSACAFTLIELLVVILIIGILIAVAAPSFLGQTEKAHDAEAKQYLSVAYRAAKASTVQDPYTGDYDVTTVVNAINAEGSGLSATTGNCPFSVTSTDPKDIIVDDSVTGGANLKICNDPVYRVWSLTVINHGPPEFAMVEIDSSETSPEAPVASGAGPAVSGTAQAGFSLATTDGDWDNSPTAYAYAWLRCDDTVTANIETACTQIAGETASVYTATSADVGKHLRSRVTASNAGGSSSPAFSNATAAILPAAPVASASPVLSGTAKVGFTLETTTGSWSNNPTAYSYSWLRCDDDVDANIGTACTSITSGDATDNNDNYTAVAGDVGKYLRASVTASNAGGSTTARSAASAVVLPLAPVSTGLPTLTPATAVVVSGQVTSSTGSWDNGPTSYSYSWLRCDQAGANCVAIGTADATDDGDYTPVAADVDKRLRVRVTAANAGGSSSPVDSAATTAVGANNYQAQVHTDAPVAYWKLDETSGGSLANSGTVAVGSLTASGGYTLNQTGGTAGGRSILLNGTSGELYLAGGHTALNITGDLTLEMWVNVSTISGSNEYLLCKEVPSTYQLNYCLYAHAGGNYFFRQGNGTAPVIDLTGPALTVGSWKHVAITVSGSTVTQYVNGVQVAQGTRSGPAATNNASLNVGMGLHGYVDEVAVYSSALSQARLQAHYAAG